MNVLDDVAKMEPSPPAARDVNILEDHVGARVCLVAANDTWRQHGIIDLHIVESHVLDSDQFIGWAVDKRVQHASWVVAAVWLMLLLGPNVDTPPERLVNLDVIVEDVRDFTTRAWQHRLSHARVVLDIDALEGVVHLAVQELNVFDAAVVVLWHDCADRETCTVVDVDVSHNDVLRAPGVSIVST